MFIKYSIACDKTDCSVKYNVLEYVLVCLNGMIVIWCITSFREILNEILRNEPRRASRSSPGISPISFLSINDISENNMCNIRLFAADDTILFIDFGNKADGTESINNGLQKFHTWAKIWLVSFCPSKSEAMFVSSKNWHAWPIHVYFGGSPIQEISLTPTSKLVLSLPITCRKISTLEKWLTILRKLSYG